MYDDYLVEVEVPFGDACLEALSISWASPRTMVPPAYVDSLIDTIACMSAGRRHLSIQRLRARWEDPSGLLLNDRYSGVRAQAAAFLNAASGHAFDLDDTQVSTTAHCSNVVWACLFAHCDDAVRGPELFDAYSVALAFTSQLRRFIVPDHIRHGWHATATIGGIAASVARSRLDGMDLATTWQALGVVASLLSGIRANTFSGLKSIHAGRAAENALVASELLDIGLLASPGAVAEFGRAFGFAALGNLTEPADSSDVVIKRFPTCSGTHAVIEGVFIARSLGTIGGLEVEVPQLCADETTPRWPRNLVEARMAIGFVAAVAAIYGNVGEESLSRGLDDAAVHELFARVRVLPHPRWDDSAYRLVASVRAYLEGGRMADIPVDLSDPVMGGSFRRQMVIRKWQDAMASQLDRAASDAILRVLLDLPNSGTVGDVLAALSRNGGVG